MVCLLFAVVLDNPVFVTWAERFQFASLVMVWIALIYLFVDILSMRFSPEARE